MPGGGPHSFLASSRSFVPHPFCWCRWGQREEGGQEHGFAAHLQALASPQGAMKPLRWDKGAIEPWDTGLLLEKTLHRLGLGKSPPYKSQSWRSEPARWKRSCGDRPTSVTELAHVSQADPEALTLA